MTREAPGAPEKRSVYLMKRDPTLRDTLADGGKKRAARYSTYKLKKPYHPSPKGDSLRENNRDNGADEEIDNLAY
jgi:hypothetical protein